MRFSAPSALSIAALVVASTMGGRALGTGPLHPVALTGVEGALGPGLGAGVTFLRFDLTGWPNAAPSLTGTNSLSFAATLAGGNVSADNNEALIVSRGSGLEVLARKGSPAAGLAPGIVYAGFVGEANLSSTGKAAFIGIVSGTGVDNSTNDCFWADPPTGGPLALMLRENVTVADGTPGVLFGDQANPGFTTPTMWGQWQPVMSVNGTAMQRAAISSPGDGPQWGVWYNPTGPFTSYFINCNVLPDSNPPRTFCGLGGWYINASGAIITARGDSINGGGLWSSRALDAQGRGIAGVGPVAPVAQRGEPAPNTVETWDGFDRFSQNKNGRVAFSAAFPGVPLSGGGIWSDGRFGVLQSIALTGGAAPGSSGTFHIHGVSIAKTVLISDSNSVTFHGRLWQTGDIGPSNDEGLWSNRALSGSNPVGNLRKVFVESDPVPEGLGPDYDGLTFLAPISFWVNGTGRSVVFVNHNDFTRGLWMERPDGTLTPIAKEFTVFDVFGNGSDMRLITSIKVVGNAASGDGIRTGFNDGGEVAFRLAFADGSEGIFTTAPNPVAACAPDYDHSGTLSVQDIFDFLNGWFAGAAQADFNHSGGLEVQDIFDFLNAWFGGC